MKDLSPALLLSALLHLAAASGLLWFGASKPPITGAPTISVSLIDTTEAHRPKPQPQAQAEIVPAVPDFKPKPVPSPLAKLPISQPLPQNLPQELTKTANDELESLASFSTPVQSPITAEPVSIASFNADYLHNPKPQYPALSRRLGEQGRVLLHVQVSPQGSAIEVTVKKSSGFKRLDQAAVDVVKRWQFVPAQQGSTPLLSWVDVPLQFSLEK